jgi:hypothetical protein
MCFRWPLLAFLILFPVAVLPAECHLGTWPRDQYSGPGGGNSSDPGGGLYRGPGGGASTDPGGGMYNGPGGALNAGPDGGLYDGPGGGLYDGPGGGLYAGPGGHLYDGPGGGLYDGPGGGLYAGPGFPYCSRMPPWAALVRALESKGKMKEANLIRMKFRQARR